MFFDVDTGKSKNSAPKRCAAASNEDRFGQLVVDVVPSVLDGHGAAALAPGYHGDGFTAVAAKGEEEGVQLLVVGFDTPDQIFFTFNSGRQIHAHHLVSKVDRGYSVSIF